MAGHVSWPSQNILEAPPHWLVLIAVYMSINRHPSMLAGNCFPRVFVFFSPLLIATVIRWPAVIDGLLNRLQIFYQLVHWHKNIC